MTKIPEISDKKLKGLMKKIRPVIRCARVTTSRGSELEQYDEGDLYYIANVDPRKIAFTWDPKPTREASEINPDAYKEIVTLHSYGAPVYFKPSIAEVLAQIPEEDIKRCAAFETDHLGFTEDSRYHTAQTRLYERKR